MGRKSDTSFVGRAWSVSVTALYKIVVYHQLSRSSSIIWNGDDRKSDTSICRNGVKCFDNRSVSYNSFCCISSIVRIFIDFLKWRWQEKRQLNLSKRHKVFQLQLYIRLLYIINYQDLHRVFEMEMTGKATPQFAETAWNVSKTALLTIVVYNQLSGSSWVFWKRDDRKSDTSFVGRAWSVSVTALNTFVVYHQLSGSSSNIWNGEVRKSNTSIYQEGMKCSS